MSWPRGQLHRIGHLLRLQNPDPASMHQKHASRYSDLACLRIKVFPLKERKLFGYAEPLFHRPDSPSPRPFSIRYDDTGTTARLVNWLIEAVQ